MIRIKIKSIYIIVLTILENNERVPVEVRYLNELALILHAILPPDLSNDT